MFLRGRQGLPARHAAHVNPEERLPIYGSVALPLQSTASPPPWPVRQA
jgi:hypothetical protein